MKDPAIIEAFAKTYDLANKLSITGTPSYVVGNEVVFGALGAGCSGGEDRSGEGLRSDQSADLSDWRISRSCLWTAKERHLRSFRSASMPTIEGPARRQMPARCKGRIY